MSKVAATVTLSLLLCFCFGFICASSRPILHFHPISSLHHQEYKAAAKSDHELNDESCEGVDDECLMRRTLAAHVDYIYTQKHKPRN